MWMGMLEWSAPVSEFLVIESLARCCTSPANSLRFSSSRCLNSANSSGDRCVLGNGLSSMNWSWSCEGAEVPTGRLRKEEGAVPGDLPALVPPRALVFAVFEVVPLFVRLAAIADDDLTVLLIGIFVAAALVVEVFFFFPVFVFFFEEATVFFLVPALGILLREVTALDFPRALIVLAFVRFATKALSPSLPENLHKPLQGKKKQKSNQVV